MTLPLFTFIRLNVRIRSFPWQRGWLKYIHFGTFIRSLFCFSFLSSPPMISLLFFSVLCFFNSRSTRTCRCHDPFSAHFRFFGSEQPRSQSSSAISDKTSPVKLVGKIRAIALGSKPPLVTRIARTGLGTRLVVRNPYHLRSQILF